MVVWARLGWFQAGFLIGMKLAMNHSRLAWLKWLLRVSLTSLQLVSLNMFLRQRQGSKKGKGNMQTPFSSISLNQICSSHWPKHVMWTSPLLLWKGTTKACV
jgi:hypothetical protein